MRMVLDASVAVKWLLPEEDSEKARHVFSEWNAGRIDLVAPSLLPAEAASALWKKVRKKEVDKGRAAQLFWEFQHLNVPLVPADGLVFSALDFAFLYGHPVYDCIYVALAVRERCRLLTADDAIVRRFRNPKSGSKQLVCLLKDWQP